MNYRIAQDIETVRELQDLTIQEMSDRIGISRITLNNWLTRKKEPNEVNLSAFYEYAFRSGIRLNRIKEQFYREDAGNKSSVLLFQGAKAKIEGPLSIAHSRMNNDFGQGFYCGESLEQSAMFVSNYPDSSLYILQFERGHLRGRTYDVGRDWMLMIAYYRNRLGQYAGSDVIKKLLQKNRDIDYIIAPIADNRMFEIIDQFIDGEITDVQCQHCLSATNLGRQYVFITDKALSRVSILERCYLTESEKKYYLNSRQESVDINRDKVKIARKQYRNQGEYIEDILK